MAIKKLTEPVRPTYQSQYGSQMDDLYKQYTNRQFNFDVNKDALWKQMTQQYQQGGQLAMQNTVGQVTAQTGGYGNSFAQTAGQQTYQQYMNGLYDMLPQVQNMARQNYDAETSRIMNMYSMMADKEGRDYNRYQDQLAQYNTDMNRYQNQQADEQARADKEQEKSQEAADTMIAYYISNGMKPPEDLYAKSAYDRRYWETMLANNQAKKNAVGSTYSSGSKYDDVWNHVLGLPAKEDQTQYIVSAAQSGLISQDEARKMISNVEWMTYGLNGK